MSEILKVVLPAGQIPHGSWVTKVRGENLYTLVTCLRIFTPKALTKTIAPAPGTVFLISGGNANIVHETTELVWHVTLEQLQYWSEVDSTERFLEKK